MLEIEINPASQPMSEIQPIKFINVGTELEMRFIKDDVYVWCAGVVAKVGVNGIDDQGSFLECDVTYSDGEVVENTRLYDVDFDDAESLDGWRFVQSPQNPITQLITCTIKNTKALKDVKASLQVVQKMLNDHLDEFYQDDGTESQSPDEESDDDRSVTVHPTNDSYGAWGPSVWFPVIILVQCGMLYYHYLRSQSSTIPLAE